MGAFENTLAGASTGAAIGSAVPVIGTAIGAGAGALIGGLGTLIANYMAEGDDEATATAKAQAMIARTRNGFQAQQANLGPDYNFTNALDASQRAASLGVDRAFGAGDQQQALADALRAQAEGRGGPSLAEMQLAQATDRTAKQAAGMIGAQRGLSAGTATRLAANAGAAANQEAAGQAAMIRAQEQMQAQAALAQQLAAMRGGDINQQQASQGLFGQAGALRGDQRGQNLQNFQQTQALNAGVAAGNQQAAMHAEALAQNDAARAQQMEQAQQARTDRVLGGVANAAARYGARENMVPTTSAPPVNPLAPGAASQAPVGAPAGWRAAEGGVVPGRARRPGDSPENDTVSAALSPGEIVLPRSITRHRNAPAMAQAFVQALMAQGGGR